LREGDVIVALDGKPHHAAFLEKIIWNQRCGCGGGRNCRLFEPDAWFCSQTVILGFGLTVEIRPFTILIFGRQGQ